VVTDGPTQPKGSHVIDARTPAAQLPEDMGVLQQMVLQLLANVESLQQQLTWYQRHLFGRRSEKLDPNQALLFELPPPVVPAPAVPPATSVARPPTRPSRRNGRVPLPAHLPRERIEHHPPQEALVCPQCGGAKEPMGEEITEQLDYVPASFIVRQHVRVKYACKPCQEGVVIADLPAQPIEKGRPGEGLLAQVLTSKYGDHLPLHRQEAIYRRHGVEIHRSTMCDWVGECAILLTPLVEEMHCQLLRSPKVHTDDTPVKARNGSGPEVHKGYLWAYIDVVNNVVFDYTSGHSREGPLAFLGDYAGYLQADAYQGYDAFFAKRRAQEVACWAHARRKFWLIRFSRTFHGGLPYEFITGFVQSVDLEFEEFGVSETVGLALQDADLGVGAFQRSGRNAIAIVVENPAAMGGEGVSESDQRADGGAFGSANPIVEDPLGGRAVGLFPDPA
jgi:transposase